MKNINTKSYWETRFGTGDWETKGGFQQTALFAESQVSLLGLPKSFNGTILDFGCGAGDAFPVYHYNFPLAKLVGIDFSQAAIDLCNKRYGDIGTFICGDHRGAPNADIIIASNVFEHLDADKEIASVLVEKASRFFIIVPFREKILPGGEHINSYDVKSFDYLDPVRVETFYSKGWSHHGLSAAYQIHLKNIARLVLGRQLLRREKQVIYEINRPEVFAAIDTGA